MRILLLLGTLLTACAAVAGVLWIGSAPPPPVPEPGARAGSGEPVVAAHDAPGEAAPSLRAWRTLATLREDLRDALAHGDVDLAGAVADVSRELGGSALRVLRRTAREERSPRVRALLVFAAGVHRPDDPALLRYLADPFPVVRTAAVLATACSTRTGAPTHALLPGLAVPVGRGLPAATDRALGEAGATETDATVRAAIAAVRAAR